MHDIQKNLRWGISTPVNDKEEIENAFLGFEILFVDISPRLLLSFLGGDHLKLLEKPSSIPIPSLYKTYVRPQILR